MCIANADRQGSPSAWSPAIPAPSEWIIIGVAGASLSLSLSLSFSASHEGTSRMIHNNINMLAFYLKGSPFPIPDQQGSHVVAQGPHRRLDSLLELQKKREGNKISDRRKTIDEFRMTLFGHPTPFSTTDVAYASIPRQCVTSSTGPHDLVIVVNRMALDGQRRSWETRLLTLSENCWPNAM